MDPIIDKINAIEQAASRIMDEAARTAREQDAAHEIRIKAADLSLEEDREKQLAGLRHTLDVQLASAREELEADARRMRQELDSYYNSNRESLAASIFDTILRK